MAVEDEQQSGDFNFDDNRIDGLSARYYRVLTQ